MPKDKFYYLRDKFLNKFVSHISFTAYSCIVSCSSDWLSGILFSYDHAVIMANFLEENEHECYGYDIVDFDLVQK